MRFRFALLGCLLISFGAGPTLAQTSETEQLRARVKALERTVAELEAKLRALEAQTPGGSCGGASAAAPAESWRDPACWERLRKGMSRFAVLRLLGEPGKLSAYEGFERWEYPAALGARVNFNEHGEVVSWRPPPPEAQPR